jgi:hypothetical protein
VKRYGTDAWLLAQASRLSRFPVPAPPVEKNDRARRAVILAFFCVTDRIAKSVECAK